MNDVRQRLTQAAADDGVPLRTDLHDLLKRARADKRRYRTRVSLATAATTAAVLVGGGFAFQALAGTDGASPAPADSRRETSTATATAAAQVPEARWVSPVKGCHISDRFGTKGPLYNRGFHTGLDFRCGYGKPIRAITDGTVTEKGFAGAYGNKTVLMLADGTELWFTHQSAYTVKKGDRVKAGDVIGYVGMGHSYEPHLHLEVHPGGGDPVDPATVLTAHGVELPEDRTPEWMLPLVHYRITTRFGVVAADNKRHTGLDFATSHTATVRAIADGTVTETAYRGDHGNRTIITLADGTELWFSHQSAFAVEVGDQVKAGDVIGYVGKTGKAYGPHLHLEVHPGGGDPVDPAKALAEHGVRLNG